MKLIRFCTNRTEEEIRELAESINLEVYQFRQIKGFWPYTYFYICEHEERKAREFLKQDKSSIACSVIRENGKDTLKNIFY